MALEQQLMNDGQQPTEQAAPKQPQQERLDEQEEKDLRLAVLVTERMLEDGGFDVIDQALESSSDPAQVIGQFLLQLIQKMNEMFVNENQLSRRIWLCAGGWAEQVMDFIIDEYNLDYAVADKAEVYLAETITQMAQANQQQAQQQQQQMAAPQQQGVV